MKAHVQQSSPSRFDYGRANASEPGLLDPNLPLQDPHLGKVAKSGANRPQKDAQPGAEQIDIIGAVPAVVIGAEQMVAYYILGDDLNRPIMLITTGCRP